MTPIKVLFIEDEPDNVGSVMDLLHKNGEEYKCDVTNFADYEDAIDTIAPDVIVLDLLGKGSPAERDVPGKAIFDSIWKSRYRPIVVYSAQPDALEDSRTEHPFVKSVQKGSGSEKQVMSKIAELKPQVEALHQAEQHIRQQLALALREVAPYAFKTFPDPPDSEKRNNMIVRAGRRRLAALMDDFSKHGQSLASWEQYLCPPISEDLQLGDILHKNGKPNEDPTSFCVVLTPSCDLVASEGRQPKVDCVLVARCEAFPDSIKETSLGKIGKSKLRNDDRLEKTILRTGYFETILPFPAFEGRIPHMAADLRGLELIPLDQIGDDGSTFSRVASIDSPFRELVAWAYMQIACRPGLPVRDCKTWSDEILRDYPDDTEKHQ